LAVTKCSDIEGTKIEDPHPRIIKILSSPVTKERESIGFTFGMSIIPPKERTQKHSHEGTEESIYVASGRGFVKVGNEEEAVEPDSVILVRAGEPHEFHNTSDETMKLVWVYCPPGAEKSLLSKAV
jgi:quercetin dioxygenase-like cupin family protein